MLSCRSLLRRHSRSAFCRTEELIITVLLLSCLQYTLQSSYHVIGTQMTV